MKKATEKFRWPKLNFYEKTFTSNKHLQTMCQK